MWIMWAVVSTDLQQTGVLQYIMPHNSKAKARRTATAKEKTGKRHAFVTHLITFLLCIIRSFEDSFMQEDNSPYERKCHAFAHEIKC